MGLCYTAEAQDQTPGAPDDTQPEDTTTPNALTANAPENDQAPISLVDPEDDAFDISAYLSTRSGFLPLAMPITEPAVGYGLTLGLTLFHGTPKLVPGDQGEPNRAIMPSTTVVFGAATENETSAGGLGFRYLIAKEYGLRLGADVAYGDDNATIYISIDTGWIRP